MQKPQLLLLLSPLFLTWRPLIGSNLCFSFQRYWDREVQQAAKDLRSPQLTKVLVQCYWRSYLLIGIYIFIEVRCHLTVKCDGSRINVASYFFHLTVFFRKLSKLFSPCYWGK